MSTYETTYGIRENGIAGVTVRGTRSVLLAAGYLEHLHTGADSLAMQMCAEAARQAGEDNEFGHKLDEHGKVGATCADDGASLPKADGEQRLTPLEDITLLDATRYPVSVQLVETVFDVGTLRQVSSVIMERIIEPLRTVA